MAPNGRLVVEVVAQFTQTEQTQDTGELGGLLFRGGTTVVAESSGKVRFVIAKPLASAQRRNRQRGFVESHDARDPAISWAAEDYRQERIATLDLAHLHSGLPSR